MCIQLGAKSIHQRRRARMNQSRNDCRFDRVHLQHICICVPGIKKKRGGGGGFLKFFIDPSLHHRIAQINSPHWLYGSRKQAGPASSSAVLWLALASVVMATRSITCMGINWFIVERETQPPPLCFQLTSARSCLRASIIDISACPLAALQRSRASLAQIYIYFSSVSQENKDVFIWLMWISQG